MRLARTDFIVDRWARTHQEGQGFLVFLGAGGTVSTGATYMTHLEHDYGMPWPVPPLLYASIVVLVVFSYLRYRCTFESPGAVDNAYDDGHGYSSEQPTITRVFRMARSMRNPHIREMANDLIGEIESAARAMRHGSASPDEKALMADRFRAMYALQVEDHRLLQEVRTTKTLETSALDRVRTHLSGRDAIAEIEQKELAA